MPSPITAIYSQFEECPVILGLHQINRIKFILTLIYVRLIQILNIR